MLSVGIRWIGPKRIIRPGIVVSVNVDRLFGSDGKAAGRRSCNASGQIAHVGGAHSAIHQAQHVPRAGYNVDQASGRTVSDSLGINVGRERINAKSPAEVDLAPRVEHSVAVYV